MSRSRVIRSTLVLLVLTYCAACAPVRPNVVDVSLRDRAVPIGAISRFEAMKFDGAWNVHSTAGGIWDLRDFAVAGGSALWSEGQGARTAQVQQRATGILRLTYGGGVTRDLWVVWIDPDHNTVALGDPDGQFGHVATRVGKTRADQVTAALQVLAFNGYRTEEWKAVR